MASKYKFLAAFAAIMLVAWLFTNGLNDLQGHISGKDTVQREHDYDAPSH